MQRLASKGVWLYFGGVILLRGAAGAMRSPAKAGWGLEKKELVCPRLKQGAKYSVYKFHHVFFDASIWLGSPAEAGWRQRRRTSKTTA